MPYLAPGVYVEEIPHPRLYLLPGRDKRAARGHPWVYANEVRMDEAVKSLAPGSLVTLHRIDGKPLGVGTFNPHALIAFRFLSRDARAPVDTAFFTERIGRALFLRKRLYHPVHYYRVAHAEADGLPGLVIDRFGDAVVVQSGTAGMDALMPHVLDALDSVLEPKTVVVRSDGRGRALEGLDPDVRTVKGGPAGVIRVIEGNLRFVADLGGGQKTGWFFDQRENRARVAALAVGATMLDVYCYAGGFAVSAAAAGAESVTAIDSSQAALARAAEAAEINGVADRCTFVRGEAFAEMERLDMTGTRFGVVVADPPAFVKSKRDLASGLKGYTKLARLATRLVAPGGLLFIASCSHNVDAAQFAGAVSKGIRQAGRTGRILETRGAAPDHPVHPELPESAYLKALILNLD